MLEDLICLFEPPSIEKLSRLKLELLALDVSDP